MANNKQLPDWKDAPEWANWRAIDQNGELCYYLNKPIMVRESWDIEDFGQPFERVGKFNHTDWQNSLEHRPENTAPTPDELAQMCGPNYELWEYLHNELGIIALDGQLGDIIEIVRRIEQKRKEQQ